MRAVASHATRELEAVEGTGHGDIADDRANLSALGHRERILAVRGDDHVEARLAQHIRKVDAHERLILDDEDRGRIFCVNAVHE